MARKPTPLIELAADVALPEEQLNATQNGHALAAHLTMDITDTLMAAGRIQALSFVATVADVAIAQTFSNIKKSKGYKDAPYLDEAGNLRHVADLDEFCRVFLKKSYRRCMELADNLQCLGSELYEHAEQIGFRARDYQVLKALPDNEQAIVKQAIETEEREQVIDLLHGLAAKLTEERKHSEEARERQAATERVLQDKNTKIDELATQLARKPLFVEIPLDEQLDELRLAATAKATVAEAAIAGQLHPAIHALMEKAAEGGTDQRALAAGLLAQVERALLEIRAEYGIDATASASTTPAWLREDAEELVAQALAEAAD